MTYIGGANPNVSGRPSCGGLRRLPIFSPMKRVRDRDTSGILDGTCDPAKAVPSLPGPLQSSFPTASATAPPASAIVPCQLALYPVAHKEIAPTSTIRGRTILGTCTIQPINQPSFCSPAGAPGSSTVCHLFPFSTAVEPGPETHSPEPLRRVEAACHLSLSPACKHPLKQFRSSFQGNKDGVQVRNSKRPERILKFSVNERVY